MRQRPILLGVTALAILSTTVLGCGAPTSEAAQAPQSALAVSAEPITVPATEPAREAPASNGAAATTAAFVSDTASQTPAGAAAVTFTGSRTETETFIRYYKTIHLTPEQERIKVEALSAIPAPCCAENPLSTCCCPCNMAKAAWGLSAWLITEKGYGVEQVRQAAKDWLAASNPHGFSGNSCHTGGCTRAIHQNGCGGMNDAQVL